ncbi:alpha-1B-glycoprotein [Cynocephalus volans]|uniref:alpha-1B-glycoprotein n=1 Tax=Cynocephalus volans TaxID=110931 RepID=UPI002FC63979
MSMLVAFLLVWGLTLGPATDAATFFDPRPSLWAESESLLEPWAKVRLTCQAHLETLDFQLFKDGVAREVVHLGSPAIEHKFLLGAVTNDTRGLYRCHSGMDTGWTGLSNLLEVTGTEPLPPPRLSAEPVSWITPGLNTTLLCHGGLQGVTFLLKREGDDEFLEVAEAGKDTKATFPVHRAGNYSCSYRTHAAGSPSEPSTSVTIQELAAPPPPKLSIERESATILPTGARGTFSCVAPLSGVHFQLRQGQEVLLVPMFSTNPERIFFSLEAVAQRHSGSYTCRYRLRGNNTLWSGDSAPVELLVSDEKLPAPKLSAEPERPSPAPGTLVRLRCQAPRAGLRFALLREDARGRRVHSLLSPAGAEALFELRGVSVVDSANYSCVYVDLAPPFQGSAPSAHWELRVDEPPHKPQLRPLWNGAVTPGRDAVLHCEGHRPQVTFELLQDGEPVPWMMRWSTHNSVDFVLTYVGPQHAGNYSCRYGSTWPKPFLSELSDPVELLVAGS